VEVGIARMAQNTHRTELLLLSEYFWILGNFKKLSSCIFKIFFFQSFSQKGFSDFRELMQYLASLEEAEKK